MTVRDVRAWVDTQLVSDAYADWPLLPDLAVVPADRVADAVTLLGQFPEAPPSDVQQLFASLVEAELRSGEVGVEHAVQALRAVSAEVGDSDSDYANQLFMWESAIDLVHAGIFGTLDQLRVEILAGLAPYQR